MTTQIVPKRRHAKGNEVFKDFFPRKGTSLFRAKVWRLKAEYGISHDEYMRLVETQKNLCGICKTRPLYQNGILHVDHDHQTKRVRGLLCRDCNRGLGLFRDSIQNLMMAIAYLVNHHHPESIEKTNLLKLGRLK